MLTERRQLLATSISSAVGIFLALGGLLLASCDRPPVPDSPASSSPTSSNSATVAGVVLRADPNPILVGTPSGKTMITWDTGSDAVGDVYVIRGENEKLFASGFRGSQEAPWIPPGSTEFRLYNHADHKLLAQLSVTLLSSDVPTNNPATTPISPANP